MSPSSGLLVYVALPELTDGDYLESAQKSFDEGRRAAVELAKLGHAPHVGWFSAMTERVERAVLAKCDVLLTTSGRTGMAEVAARALGKPIYTNVEGLHLCQPFMGLKNPTTMPPKPGLTGAVTVDDYRPGQAGQLLFTTRVNAKLPPIAETPPPGAPPLRHDGAAKEGGTVADMLVRLATNVGRLCERMDLVEALGNYLGERLDELEHGGDDDEDGEGGVPCVR